MYMKARKPQSRKYTKHFCLFKAFSSRRLCRYQGNRVWWTVAIESSATKYTSAIKKKPHLAFSATSWKIAAERKIELQASISEGYGNNQVTEENIMSKWNYQLVGLFIGVLYFNTNLVSRLCTQQYSYLQGNLALMRELRMKMFCRMKQLKILKCNCVSVVIILLSKNKEGVRTVINFTK